MIFVFRQGSFLNEFLFFVTQVLCFLRRKPNCNTPPRAPIDRPWRGTPFALEDTRVCSSIAARMVCFRCLELPNRWCPNGHLPTTHPGVLSHTYDTIFLERIKDRRSQDSLRHTKVNHRSQIVYVRETIPVQVSPVFYAFLYFILYN